VPVRIAAEPGPASAQPPRELAEIAECRRIVEAHRRRIETPRSYVADDLDTPEKRAAYVQERRTAAGEKAIDLRLIVADAAFRLRCW
jgi:hypothetical protein